MPLDLPEVSDRLVFELAPLGEEVAVRLAGSGSGPVLAPSQVAAIVERANGNPMFLRELLRAAGQAGSVEGLPESLEPLLATQIDLLSPSDRQVLRAAAVLGTHFDPGLLHELLEEGAILDSAVWDRLGAYTAPTAVGRRFAHGLMRDAAYEGLAFKRRRELHARAARAIESRMTAPDEGAEILSLHWLNAERYEQAWHYSRLAGDRARALWANAEAATFYRAGTRSRRPPPHSPTVRSFNRCRGARRCQRDGRQLRAARARLMRRRGVSSKARWTGRGCYARSECCTRD